MFGHRFSYYVAVGAAIGAGFSGVAVSSAAARSQQHARPRHRHVCVHRRRAHHKHLACRAHAGHAGHPSHSRNRRRTTAAQAATASSPSRAGVKSSTPTRTSSLSTALTISAGLHIAGAATQTTGGAANQTSSLSSSSTLPFGALPTYAPNSIWSTPVDGAQGLDPASAAIVARLLGMVNSEESTHNGPWINTTQYSIPVYTVPSGQPLVPMTIDVTKPYANPLKAALAPGVPIPAGAHPATGTDGTLVIWQPSSDTLWEFWRANLQTDGWHASWGGVMPNVSQNPGYFTSPDQIWGATATSLASTGGLISPTELQAGVINHALAMAIPATRAKQWAWPAVRSDGQDTATDSIPEGAHFRIDPGLDLNSLNLPPVTLMLARAAQKYGIIVRDKSAVVDFYAEDPTPSGTNPYPQLFGNQYPYQFLASFPWSHLQLLPMTLEGTG